MAYEQYLSSGVHIGMKQQTKDMKRFIYKTREDGLAILDLQTIDKRLQIAAKFLAGYGRIMAVSRKAVGHKATTKFAEAVNGKAVTGRFLPGIITNPAFREYYGPEVVIVTDPLVDKQALIEAIKMRVPVVSLTDTFNETGAIDLVIPVNNKGRKAVAMVYFTLAREIQKLRGVIKEDSEFKYKVEDFEVSEAEAREDSRETRERPEREPRRERRY